MPLHRSRALDRLTMRNYLKVLGFLCVSVFPQLALATSSAELLKAEPDGYGRLEARVRFAAGDGVVSSVFLWKDGSERAGTFWNEVDFEKLGADCHLQTNPIYGNPSANHSQTHALTLDLCGAFHTYTYEWTPEALVWLVDGTEIRRETGATAQAFAQNATGGMQVHLNLWPGDASFGGTFSPGILPVHEYVDWVQFSAYQDGAFAVTWREDFAAASLPAGWSTGNWASPKNKSTHAPENVNFVDGYAVLSLTADDELGPAGAMPGSTGGSPATGGASAGGGSLDVGGGASNVAGSSTGATPSDEGGCSFRPEPRRSEALGSLAVAGLTLFARGARARRRAAPTAVRGAVGRPR
jgi:endo-1,3-1,4-beta-glycanase ExoK